MSVTVGQVIQRLVEPCERLDDSVDRLIAGTPETRVTGIATVFSATHEAVERAAALGANLLITHEGTFYNHQERTDWLQDSPVYQNKRRLIEESGMAIYRFHDHWHRYRPDGIMAGLIQALDWEPFVEEHLPAASVVSLPVRTVREIAGYVKEKLGIPHVRVAGDPSLPCSRVGLLVGYRGSGANAIPLFEQKRLDLVIAGEGPEWETPEYVRDAASQGNGKAVLFLGHEASEEPGMRYLAERLKEAFPEVPVHFIASKPVFTIV
ncbi:Nif3-like dinuclear metal center hexameric protein [Cohnella laeviribosi]|uniref:Nif3-like dinuclear metal center hexameric protein n=1 Tax=Cohnella laeviribosi TaxID=380174 RepID=UPI00039E5DE8|nr:Nif3-like dinuclear metal center hexameric protein [Cohnella laeviribosi]